MPCTSPHLTTSAACHILAGCVPSQPLGLCRDREERESLDTVHVGSVVKTVISAILPKNAMHGTIGAAIPAQHSAVTQPEARTEPGCVVFVSQEKCVTVK